MVYTLSFRCRAISLLLLPVPIRLKIVNSPCVGRLIAAPLGRHPPAPSRGTYYFPLRFSSFTAETLSLVYHPYTSLSMPSLVRGVSYLVPPHYWACSGT